MKLRDKPNILFWALLLYAMLFLSAIAAFLVSYQKNGISLITLFFLLVIIFSIYVFFRRVLIPVRILQRKRNQKIDVRINGFKNSWETLNNLLSGEWIHIMRENTRLLEKDYANDILLNQIRFRTLQSQINPHFLYNALDSIRGLALIENSPQTAEMAEALGGFFRYNISQSISIVKLEYELHNIENYFIIQRYRFANRFTLEYDFDQTDRDLLDYPIPKLTIQPLVENAVFHGLERKRGNGKVIINIEKTSSRLFIRVKDNGIGMDENAVSALNESLRHDVSISDNSDSETKNGIGLLNISQRIHSIYGLSYGANFSSTVGLGTEIEITLPFPAIDNLEGGIS